MDQLSAVDLNTWILQCLIRYFDLEDVCYDLYDRYKEDFEGWTAKEFGKTYRPLQYRFRTFLCKRGIYVLSKEVAKRLEELV